MAFSYFENAINSGAQPLPDEAYREQQQAFLDTMWDNTTATVTMQEQQGIGSNEYADIEVWIDSTIADTTTGQKNTYDFNKIVFKDINHTVTWGLMYKFANNYWIVHAYSPWSGVVQFCGIRRCNNRLRMIDPKDGSIFTMPCVVNYDMAASSLKVSRYINTPNNHATVLVQGNADTIRLFKTNTRFMLSGRPFKLLGYQNAVEHDLTEQYDTLMQLELYLDELHDGDDIVNGIADNGQYDYSISMGFDNIEVQTATSGKFTLNILLNGNEVSRKVSWEYDNTVINIADDGAYTVIGDVGESTDVTAFLSSNPDVSTTFTVTVVDNVVVDWRVDANPALTTIKQYESIDIEYIPYKNGIKQDNITVVIDSPSTALSITAIGNNSYKFTGAKISSLPIEYNIELYEGDTVVYSTTESITVTSMLGG